MLNITSLPKHIDEICVLLATKNFDILALNETRLDHSIPDDLVNIPYYDIIRNDRNRNGGGVCIYVRNTISYRNLSHTIPDNLEAVVVEIHKPNSRPFIVSTIYRPPNSTVDIFGKIEYFISKFDCEHNEFYLLGDLNCNMLDTSSHVTKKLNLLLESYQLYQMINQPTRVTQFTSSLLDICVTSNPEHVILTDVVPLGVSDHNIIYVVRKINSNVKINSHRCIEIRNYKHFNCAKILKIAAPVIAQSLTNLFNYSIQTEIFPTEWKVAKIIPLHKSGPKNLADNYRPISILSAISKIFEKILHKQLLAYLNNNNLISKHQFGFRPMHSTADALLHSTNEWYRNMDDGMLNIAVFLDLKKAFDTVNHEILIGKLSFLGMQPCALNLITSYLENRSQRCYVNGYLSKPQKIDYGVPQGSILGPLLFLIYINDLPNCIEKSTVRMFADDTTLTASGIALPEIESKINHDLINVQKWLLANKLCLNLIKTEYLLIGSKQMISKLTNDPVIQIANRLVNRVTNKKSLGVVIDQYLLWDNHLDEICKKVSSGIGAIRKLKPYVTRETLVSVYCALVQPYFDYCCLVWEPIGATLSNRLQSLQNRVARVILGYRNEHGQSEAALNELQWKTLMQRRLVMKARLMYRIIHGQAPAVLIESFQNPIAPQHDYNLRNSDFGFYLTKPKTEYMKKSISYSGAKLWNNLPSEVRNSTSINTFNSLISDISLS